jgi:RNA polymerase sigma factor (sigma-70 family)
MADPEGFVPFYRGEAESVLTFMTRRTSDHDVALDLTAETFAQAWRAWPRVRTDSSEEMRAWLFTIARRQLSHYLRSGHAQRRAVVRLGIRAPSAHEDDLAAIDDAAGLAQLRRELAVELGRLSSQQRHALQLRVVEEMPYDEVAQRLGVSEPAARARVSRGLRTLERATGLRLLATVAAIAIVLAGVAFAAEQLIGTGAPVKPVVGVAVFPNTATSGEGLAIPASVRLLGLASADPGGGPAWGMRVFDTTRGVGCVQVGRLLGGQLGVLGQDGAFADDGRFHALPLRQSEGYERCTALDAQRQTYLAESIVGVAASAYQRGCTPRWNEPAPGEPASCPAADERELDFGLLGPRALSITYEADGHTHTIPTVGPRGAYLIVTALTPAQLASRKRPRPLPPGTVVFDPQHGLPKISIDTERAMLRGMLPQPAYTWRYLQGSPHQPIRKIVYRGGYTCTLTATGGAVDDNGGPCRPVGYVPAVAPLPSSAAVAAPVHVAIRRRRIVEPNHIVWFKHEIAVTFKARVAVENVNAGYGDTLRLPAGAPCDGGVLLGGIFRDVRVGESVTIEHSPLGDDSANLLRCHGTYRGTVYYHVPTTRFPPTRESEAVVGTFSFRVR